MDKKLLNALAKAKPHWYKNTESVYGPAYGVLLRVQERDELVELARAALQQPVKGAD